MTNRVLIIDDDPLIRSIYKTALESKYTIKEAQDAIQGMESIISFKPDCVLLDNMMPGQTGFTMLNEMRKKLLDRPTVIFISGAMTEELRKNALVLGAILCFDKSAINTATLFHAVECALAAKAAMEHNKATA